MKYIRNHRQHFTVGAIVGVVVAALVAAQQTTVPAARIVPVLTVVAPQLQVLTIGDSIMRGHGLPEGQAWPSLLATSEGWTVTNVACDGAGVLTVGDPTQCTGSYDDIINTASGLAPDIVIFEGSSNDFGQDNSALLSATISEVHTIRADFPDSEIVGLSTLWGYTDPPSEVAELNAQVEQAVTMVGGNYVDLGQPMQGHPELMQADDVHPNTQGQALLAATIDAAIEAPANNARERARVNEVRIARLNELLQQTVIE